MRQSFVFQGCHSDRDAASSGRDVHGDQWSRIEEDYHGVVRTGRPNFARRSGFAINKDYVTYERILLPVSDAGDRVDALFGAAHYWMG